MIWRADPQGLWTALSDSFSSSFSSLSVYLTDSFWFGQKLWIFEQSVTRKPRETKVSFFSVGCVKAVCISAQFPKGLPALNVKLTVYYLRWTSLALCYWGFLLFLALFSPLFLQPVTSQCTYLKPTFLATFPPRLYKETVFVLCVFLTSFAVSDNESELVLLWPLRSRPVIKCRFDLKS